MSAHSSTGRASRRQREGCGFDPRCVLQLIASVAKWEGAGLQPPYEQVRVASFAAGPLSKATFVAIGQGRSLRSDSHPRLQRRIHDEFGSLDRYEDESGCNPDGLAAPRGLTPRRSTICWGLAQQVALRVLSPTVRGSTPRSPPISITTRTQSARRRDPGSPKPTEEGSTPSRSARKRQGEYGGRSSTGESTAL